MRYGLTDLLAIHIGALERGKGPVKETFFERYFRESHAAYQSYSTSRGDCLIEVPATPFWVLSSSVCQSAGLSASVTDLSTIFCTVSS